MARHTRKAISLASALALAAGCLAGCGQQSDAQFNASFDKSLHDSCVTSFTSHGGPADKAEPYCSCVTREMDKLSTQDKMTLPLHQEKMAPAAQTCLAQVSGSSSPANSGP